MKCVNVIPVYLIIKQILLKCH